MEIIATASDNEPIIARAFAAYYRAGNRQGHTGNEINIPANTSYLCEHDGMHYVVLENVNGILAVYRVRNDGVLKGLRRWPRAIEPGRTIHHQHSHTTGVPEMTAELTTAETYADRVANAIMGTLDGREASEIVYGDHHNAIVVSFPRKQPDEAVTSSLYDAIDGFVRNHAESIASAVMGLETHWSDHYPDGRTIFYEGDDPEGFRQQIITEFGFDPAEKPGLDIYDGTGTPVSDNTWSEEFGWRFHCPPEHLDAIYGGNRFPMGS